MKTQTPNRLMLGGITSHAKLQQKRNMKHTHAVIIAVLLGLAVTLFADEKPASAPSLGSHETFHAEVLKVFSAADGNAVFRAYLVKWKDQEVIVSDPLVGSAHRVGDTITVLAINSPYPNGEAKPGLLHFIVH